MGSDILMSTRCLDKNGKTIFEEDKVLIMDGRMMCTVKYGAFHDTDFLSHHSNIYDFVLDGAKQIGFYLESECGNYQYCLDNRTHWLEVII